MKLLLILPSPPLEYRHRTITEKTSAFLDSVCEANPLLDITILREYGDHSSALKAKKAVAFSVYRFPFDYFLFVDPNLLKGPASLPTQLVEISAKEAIVSSLSLYENTGALYDPRKNYHLPVGDQLKDRSELPSKIVCEMQSVGNVVLVPNTFYEDSWFNPTYEEDGSEREQGEWVNYCISAKSEGAKILLYKPPICIFADAVRYGSWE